MRTFIVTLFTLLATGITFAQQAEFNWSSSLTQDRAFVENNGQFDDFVEEGQPVRFALDGGTSMILFTDEGFTFRFTRKNKNRQRKRGERTEARFLEEKELISVKWHGAEANAKVKALDPTDDTHTYAMLGSDRSTSHIGDVRGFRRLMYENLYPKIDVEFVVHETEGVKYNLILHPGADASMVKMLYPKNYSPKVDAEGNVIITTSFGDIVDHAPRTFYAKSGAEIASRFEVEGNTVGFQLGEFDHSREVIIDPWVQTPAFPNSGGIWDIDVDNAGNVYIYGGDTPMRLRKYDPAGALLWTYNTPWDSANYWIGTMVTEPNTGDCFITANTDPRISRISTAGSHMWTASGGAFDEYWKLAFNCDYTRLMLGGTRLTIGAQLFPEGYGYIFEIDMNNGAQLNSQEVASVSPGTLGINNPNEVRAMCPSPNGKYYYMTLDTIGVFDENLTLGYQNIHGYTFSYQVAGYGATNQSINAMAATTDHLYTHNGSVLDKRNIVGGAILASVTIPSGTTTNDFGLFSVENGGLALDSCGNVYVGSGNGVYKFDENLNQLGFQSTPGRVYDVAVNPQGEVVACGQGFVASLALTPCAPPKAVCFECLELTPTGPYCAEDAQDTLMADPPGGTWSGPGITDPVLGIFNPSVADTGTHVIFFTPDVALVCGIDSLIIRVNYCVDLLACIDSLGFINISNGVEPYTWSQTLDTLDCSTCFPAVPPFIPGCSLPPGCAVPTTYVEEFATGSAVQPTGNWPLFIEDSQGNILQINGPSEIPACSAGCFIVANLPDTVVACTGDSAQATVLVNGAIGNITYSWNTVPPQSSATAIDLVPGNLYTVTVTDDSSCVAIDSVYVVEQECVGPVVCATPFGDMQAEGIGPFTWYEFTQSTDCSDCIEFPGFPPCSFPPGCGVIIQEYQQFAVGDMVTPTGNWPVAVVDAAGDTLIINSLAELQACTELCYIQVEVPATAFTCFGASDAEVTAVVSGAFGNVTYSLNGSPATGATFTGLGVGQYIVGVIDANLCVAADTFTVVQNPQISLQVSGTDSLCLGVTVGSATASASGGAGNFVYSWATNPVQGTPTANNLAVGTYNVTVTDDAGCTAQGSWTIEERPSVTVVATDGGDVCPGSTDGTANALASNGASPYSYSWNTVPAQNGTNATGLAPGNYQVTATDQDGCQGTASVTIGAFAAVEADAGMFTTICLGQTANLLATGGVNYQWSTGQSGSSITVSPTETTLYTVMVTDANNCVGSDTVSVAVVPIPQVSIEELDSLICDLEPPFQIVGNPPGGTFSGNGVSSTGLFEPLVAGDGVHVITYSFSSIENCDVDTSVMIVVDGTLCDVVSPNVFNPNTDFSGQADFCGNVPQNNAFNLPCLEWYPGNRVRIFDRWGRKHYDQPDYHLKPWDGGNQSDGVFFYILEIPNEEAVKGYFHLVR